MTCVPRDAHVIVTRKTEPKAHGAFVPIGIPLKGIGDCLSRLRTLMNSLKIFFEKRVNHIDYSKSY